jgi:hypothetical protein
MKKMPPKVLLDALNDNKNAIYVWVPFTKYTRQQIRVSFSEAMEWVIQVSKQNDGIVPYFIYPDNVVLGNYWKLLDI